MIHRKRTMKSAVVETTSGEEGWIARHLPHNSKDVRDSARARFLHKPYQNDFAAVKRQLNREKMEKVGV